MTEKYTETSKIKKPELSDAEKEWQKKKPQEKIEALAQQIGFERLCQLFDMLSIIDGEKQPNLILDGLEIGKQKGVNFIETGITQQKSQTLLLAGIQKLLLQIEMFILRQSDWSTDWDVFNCMEIGMKHDGISLAIFNKVKSIHDTIIDVDKKYPKFIQKNPRGEPSDYIYMPLEEDMTVITKFFPNLAGTTIQIPFKVKYNFYYTVTGSINPRPKVYKYNGKPIYLPSHKIPEIIINLPKKADSQEIRQTLMNETWHYLYHLSTPENLFLGEALSGQTIVIGKEKIPLGKKYNGENEFISDSWSMQIGPVRDIKRIWEWGESDEKREPVLIPESRSGYQFCVQVFKAVLIELFGDEYRSLIISKKNSLGNTESSEKETNKLEKILQNPEKIKRIQQRYMEVGYDLACRLGELKKSPAYTEKPARPNSLLDIIKMDMLGHPDGGNIVKPKMPPKDASIFGKN